MIIFALNPRRLLKSYFKYLTKRKGAHGLHSPFVYEFYQKVIRKKIELDSFQEKYLQTLKNSDVSFEVEDFGAGSKIFKEGERRPVSKIHKISSTTKKKGKLLTKIVDHYNLKNILELGTCLGAGTMYLNKGLKDTGEITTVEGDKNLHQFSAKMFHEYQLQNVHTVNETFDVFFKTFSPRQKIDLVFIDGNHNAEATKRYIKALNPFLHNESFIILDDIYWSDSMEKVWKLLIDDEQFHVSIDLFKMGILLPRKNQKKEHFTLKF